MDQKQEKTPKEAKTNIVVEACSCQREEGMMTEVCSDALNSSPFLENLNSVTMRVQILRSTALASWP